jgi:hypothetical protein
MKLRELIETSASRALCNLKALTVLGLQRDPYRLDTAAGHRNGAWFATMVERFVEPHGTIHLRGLHYQISSSGRINTPHGLPYTNTDENWLWLVDCASKAGRWLGYVPFERIVDERNAAPELFIPGPPTSAYTVLTDGSKPIIPQSLYDAMPTLLVMGGFPLIQPFRIILFGEKTSLASILRPIAEMVGGELLLPTGEASDTMIAGLAARSARDRRPAVVLYFSDFDPSGHQMAISVARKLQALRDLSFPELDIRLYPIALTLEQVRRLNLPSTPLKQTERRADKWRAAMGHEQTEIDALLALDPDALHSIALEAVEPFYDRTLDERVKRAEEQWRVAADRALRDHYSYEQAESAVSHALVNLQHAAHAFQNAQEAARHMLEAVQAPSIDEPEPELTAAASEPLFDTSSDFVTASTRLIKHKAFNGKEAS